MLKHKVKFAILGYTHFLWLSISLPVLANDISSIFYVSNNDNRNQAHYGIRLNQNCSPRGSNPVYVYWRMENGTTEELLEIEQPGYGIFSQSVSGERVEIILNVFQNRGIKKSFFVRAVRLTDGNCQALVFTTIKGKMMQVSRIRILLSNIRKLPLTRITIGGRVVNITLFSSTGDQEIIPCTSDCRFGL